MANKQISEFAAAGSVATTDRFLVQPGTIGTAYVYATAAQVAASGAPSVASNITLTGTVVPAAGVFLPAANTLGFSVNSVEEIRLTSAALSPTTSDGNALGTSSLMWADIFLGSGAVINFDAGNLTVTHSAGTLTISGMTAVTNLNVGGVLTVARADGISTAGSNQATATGLTGQISVVTTVTAGQGVRLPDNDHMVLNRGTINLTVYPQTSAQVEAYGTNVAVEVAPSSSANFVRMSSVLYRVT